MKKIKPAFLLVILLSMASTGVYSQLDQTWIDLDGTNDFLDFGTDNILAGKTQFTVEMRIHFNSSTGDYTIIGQRNSDVNRTIVLQRWAGAFYLFLSNYNYGYCSFIPCETHIYHLAIVYDGTGASNSDRLKLYIDGALQTLTFSGTIDNSSWVTSPAANLVLGCEDNGPTTQLQFVNGQYGELAIWNYPLTQSQVNNRINPEVLGNENGLLEYFHFDNGIAGGDNTSITSFQGGKGVCTITPKNMAMNGTTSNFVERPVAVSVDGNVITSNATGVTYQWLDCNNGFEIIPGETSASYTATADGSYAVQITLGSCVDTSTCVKISTATGTNTLQTPAIAIFPNPVTNEVIIESHATGEKLVFEISNSLGQVIADGDFIDRTVVDASGFSPGLYNVKIKAGDMVVFKKMMKD